MCELRALSRRALHGQLPRPIRSEHSDGQALPHVAKAVRAPGVIAFPESLSIERNSEQVLLAPLLKYVAIKFRIILINQIGAAAKADGLTLNVSKAVMHMTGDATLRRG